MMKIKDCYNIDLNDLCDRAEQNDYWEKAYNFFVQVKDKEKNELSEGQIRWLNKIESGMNN